MESLTSLRLELEAITVRAGEIAAGARTNMVRELKPDGSIVTNADRETETFLRDELAKLVPGSTFWGEEFGHEPEGPGGQWLIDPVDGTSNYAFGSPLWGVSVALTVGEDVLVGSVVLPELRETYSACNGGGTYLNGERLPAIPPGPVEKWELVSFGPDVIQHFAGQKVPGKMRLSGAFVVDGAFTATQRYRAMIGLNERLYDAAACVVIGREVGADIRYMDGSPFGIMDLKRPVAIERPWIIAPQNSNLNLVRSG